MEKAGPRVGPGSTPKTKKPQHLDMPTHDAILAWCDQAAAHDGHGPGPPGAKEMASQQQQMDLSRTSASQTGSQPKDTLAAGGSIPTNSDTQEKMDDARQLCSEKADRSRPVLTGVGDVMDSPRGVVAARGATRPPGGEGERFASQGLYSSNSSSTRSSGPLGRPDHADTAVGARDATSLLYEQATLSKDRNPTGSDAPVPIPLLSEPAALSEDWAQKGSSPFADASFALGSSGELFPAQPKQPVWGGAEACTQILALTTSGRVPSGVQELKGDFWYPCSSTASSLSLGVSTPSSQGFDVQHPTPWSSSGASSAAGLSAPSSQSGDAQYPTSGSGSGASSVAGLSIPSSQSYDAQHSTFAVGLGVSSAAGLSAPTSQGHDIQQQTPWSTPETSSSVIPHAPIARQPSSALRAQSAGSPMPRASSGRPPRAPRTSGSGSGTFLLQRLSSGGGDTLLSPPQRVPEGLLPVASATLSMSSKRSSSGGSSAGAVDAIGRGITEQLTLERPATAPAGLGEAGGSRHGKGLGLVSGGSGESSDASLRSASEDPSFGDQHPFGVLPGTLEAADALGKGTHTPMQGAAKPQDLPTLGRGLSIRVPNSHFAAVEAMPQNRIQVRPTTRLHSPFEAIALQPFNDSRDDDGSDTPSASSSAPPEASL